MAAQTIVSREQGPSPPVPTTNLTDVALDETPHSAQVRRSSNSKGMFDAERVIVLTHYTALLACRGRLPQLLLRHQRRTTTTLQRSRCCPRTTRNPPSTIWCVHENRSTGPGVETQTPTVALHYDGTNAHAAGRDAGPCGRAPGPASDAPPPGRRPLHRGCVNVKENKEEGLSHSRSTQPQPCTTMQG